MSIPSFWSRRWTLFAVSIDTFGRPFWIGMQWLETLDNEPTILSLFGSIPISRNTRSMSVTSDSRSKVKTLLSMHQWPTIVTSIDQELRALAAWNASNQREQRLTTSYLFGWRICLELLAEDGVTGLDEYLALFAIRSYARRNFICDGRAFDLVQA